MALFGRRRSAPPPLPDPLICIQPGPLPEDGSLELGGVTLDGRRVEATVDGGPARPTAWVTDAKCDPGDWAQIAADFPRTGLWPLLLDPDDPNTDPMDSLMELSPAPDLDSVDAEALLRRFWADSVPDSGDAEEDEEWGAVVEPFDIHAFPGLTEGPEADPDALADALSFAKKGRIVLAPVTRPADFLAAICWSGPMNHTNDVWELSAILRSWEDRFGALPLQLGFDTLELAIRRPPLGDRALGAAAEHYAFCPDNVDQGSGSIRAYAEALDGAVTWAFWWD